MRPQGPRQSLVWFVLTTFVLFLILFTIEWTVRLGNLAYRAGLALIFAVGLAYAVFFLPSTLRWSLNWSRLRRLFFALVCFATLVGLFYAEENLRGNYEWSKIKSRWEAHGVRFDRASVVPPPVPDEQNFAMNPIWVESICAMLGLQRGMIWYGDKVAALNHTNFEARLRMPRELHRGGLESNPSMGNWKQAEEIDLVAWQNYYREAATHTNVFPMPAYSQTPAEDVLSALSRYDGTIEALKQASRLPWSRFPVGYDDDDSMSILLPHLSLLKSSALTLQLRAVAALRADRFDQALSEVSLIFRLAEAIRTEPFSISHVVRIVVLSIGMQPIWEGIAEHRWSDAQLAELQAELSQFDFLVDWQSVERAELPFALDVHDYMRKLREQDPKHLSSYVANFFSASGSRTDLRWFEKPWAVTFLVRWMPRGWFDQNKRRLALAHLELQTALANFRARKISLTELIQVSSALEQIHLLPFGLVSNMMDRPLYIRLAKRFIRAQADADLARVACALERYRLLHGTFPEKLDVLVPQFLVSVPADVIDGHPLRFRLQSSGESVLYSVGVNQTDEGGKVSEDEDQGDWVWRMTSK